MTYEFEPLANDATELVAAVDHTLARELAPTPAEADALRELLGSRLAPSTKRAYQTALAKFRAWCSARDVPPAQLAPDVAGETLVLYLAYLRASGLSLSTIHKHAAALSAAYVDAGTSREALPTRALVVREALSGARHVMAGDEKRQARALTTADVRQMVDACDPATLRGLRDRAAILMGYLGGLRRSEIVSIDWSPHRTQGHVVITDRGVRVHVRKSKRDQRGLGRRYPVHRQPDTRYCLAAALEDWHRACGAPTAGAVFREVTAQGVLTDRRSAGRTVARAVKRTAKHAGVDTALLSGHSLRAGWVTDRENAGATTREIKQSTGHSARSKAYEGYYREANFWKNDATREVFG